MSKFFFRPDANPPMYGAAVYTQKDYDAITMGFQNALFTYGCDWNKDWQVEGVLNDPKCVEALEAYKALYDSRPARQHQQLLPRDERLLHQRAGHLRDELLRLPARRWPTRAPTRTTSTRSASSATRRAPTASSSPRWAARAPASTPTSTTSASRQAIDFIKWFASDEIQQKWAELGGYTCNKKALASEAFLKAAPYNGRSPRRWGLSRTSTTSPSTASCCRRADRAEQLRRRRPGHCPGSTRLDRQGARRRSSRTCGYKPSGTRAPVAPDNWRRALRRCQKSTRPSSRASTS